MIPELNGWKEKLHAREGKRESERQSEGERESREQRHCCGRNKLIYAFPCRDGDKKKSMESLPRTKQCGEKADAHMKTVFLLSKFWPRALSIWSIDFGSMFPKDFRCIFAILL